MKASMALENRQQQELVRWAKSAILEADARPVLRSTRNVSISADLGVAASYLSSLRQTGMGSGAATVIAIMGIGGSTAPAAAPPAPRPPGPPGPGRCISCAPPSQAAAPS